MHHTLELDAAHKLIIGCCRGEASLEGFRAYIGALTAAPYTGVDYPILSDFSNLSMQKLGPDDIEKVVGFVGMAGDKVLPVRHAIVVNNELAFGFARMYQMAAAHRDPQEIRIFYSRDEALRWLVAK